MHFCVAFLQRLQHLFLYLLPFRLVFFFRKDEVLVQKLAKRGVSLRSVKYGPIEQSGKVVQQLLTFAQGIVAEKAKAIVKMIKDSKLKVQGAIQGDSVRISGKSRDDLQQVMQMVRGKQDELDVDTQFENFRD